MPRRPQIRERTDRPGSFFVKLGGRRIGLGNDRAAAERRFYAIMAQRTNASAAPRPAPSISVGELFDEFLVVNQQRWTDANLAFNKAYLLQFSEFVGDRQLAADVITHDVERWALSRGWTNPNTIANAKGVIKAAFRFGLEMGLLIRNPIASLRKPTRTRREFVLAPDQQRALLASLKRQPALDRICRTMLATGARPQEARLATAAEFVAADRCLYWPAGKAPKGKDERRIYLAGDALAIVRKLVKPAPEGPLFRDDSGQPWSKETLSRSLKVHAHELTLPDLVPYTLRHTFATNALANGVDPERLRILMGHRDLSMVIRYYSHLNERRDEMRAAADRAAGRRKGGPRSR